MKITSSSRCPSNARGFTLVELLVVIGIIAILAAVLLAAGGAAIRSAQRAKAANTAQQIQTAALGYYTEYSVYPVTSAAPPGGDQLISDSDVVDWQPLIESLCGNISPHSPATTVSSSNVPTNTRAVAFLQLRASDVDANDCPLNPITANKTTHPYFYLAIDNDYDNIVGDSGTASGQLPDFTSMTIGNVSATLSKGTSGGIAIWANCNTTTTASTQNPAFYIRTY